MNQNTLYAVSTLSNLALLASVVRRARTREQRRRAMKLSARHYVLSLTGNAWVASLLDGDHGRFLARARMPRSAFFALSYDLRRRRLLRTTRSLDVDAKILLFLKIVGHGSSVRELAERFQISLHSVGSRIQHVLDAILALSPDYIKMPLAEDPTPVKVRDDAKFYPFLKNCIGAAGGTHVTVQVPGRDHSRFRNRKGGLSQNVLAMCDFEGKFIYVLAGWEGQANDMAALNDAFDRRGLVIPGNRFVLVDGGYASRPRHIAPYRGVRYHLKESERGQRGPQNAQELFNLRHASLRSVIERVFGIMKNRFAVLRHGCQHPLRTQVSLVQALCVVHNYITIHRNSHGVGGDDDDGGGVAVSASQSDAINEDATGTPDAQADELRDSIAEAMWTQYQHILNQRTGPASQS
jgi:hypothetical protein